MMEKVKEGESDVHLIGRGAWVGRIEEGREEWKG